MTRATFRMKVTVGISLAVSALAAWGIQLDRPARAGQSNDNPVDTKATAPDRPKDGVWAIKGVVVDERGNPVAGAVIHAREEADAAGAKTVANGEFTLWAGHGPMYTRELVAEVDGGARMGRVQFIPPRQSRGTRTCAACAQAGQDRHGTCEGWRRWADFGRSRRGVRLLLPVSRDNGSRWRRRPSRSG